MTSKKKELVRVSHRHKMYIFVIAVCSVLLLVGISVKSIQHTRSVRYEYTGTDNLCTSVDGRNFYTSHGRLMKAYEIKENFCSGSVTKISPVGVAVNIVPGVFVAAVFVVLSTYYMRRSVR